MDNASADPLGRQLGPPRAGWSSPWSRPLVTATPPPGSGRAVSRRARHRRIRRC